MLSLLYIDHLLVHIAAAAALYHRRQGHNATLNVFLHIYDRLVRVDLTAEPLTSIRRDMPGYTGNCRACYGGKDFSYCCFATHPQRTSSCAQLQGSAPSCSGQRFGRSLAFLKASCMVRFAALRHGAMAHAPFRDAQTTAICHCTTAMAASKCEVARPVTVLLPAQIRAVPWLQPKSEQHSS